MLTTIATRAIIAGANARAVLIQSISFVLG